MSRDKQIEEIYTDLKNMPTGALNDDLTFVTMGQQFNDSFIRMIAKYLTDKSYRKQSEGEWVRTDWGGKMCTCCNTFVNYMSKFCLNCGAKMKRKRSENGK